MFLCFEEDHREGYLAMDWFFLGIDLTLWLGICLGNGLIIAAFIRIRKLLTLSNYLILQLALADFAVGCGLLYSALTTILRELQVSHNLCALQQAMYLFPGAASVIGILAITYNRYVAIVSHPLTYQVTPRQRYYVMYTLIIWIPSVALGLLLPMMWHNRCPPECMFSLIMTSSFLKYVFLPFFVVLAFPMTVLYAHIIFAVKKQLRNISNSEGQPREPLGQPQKCGYSKRQIMIVKVCLLIFATFYISWLPFLVILGIQLYSGQLEQDSPMTTARFLTMCLIPLNSLGNPLIYGYRLPDLKMELSTMLSNWRKHFPCCKNNCA